MELNDLRSPEGAFTPRKRVGRGHGSGTGKTSGRGQKGQKSRSGHHYMPRHFVGGQRPLQQALPYKRGFKNRFRVEYTIVSLDRLAAVELDGEITPELMVTAGLIRDTKGPIKILAGDNELTKPLRVQAHRISASAKAAIEAAGGQVTLIGVPAEVAEAVEAATEEGQG
jgi:large subunit ribosomal protein L15